MKTLDAIRAKMFPYELPDETLEFLLDEQDLQASEEYDKDTDRELLMKAVIAALYQLISLSKEKDNGSEVQYNPDAIMQLIRRYEDELKPVEKRGVNRDMTHIW
jgi:hypothetical protein